LGDLCISRPTSRLQWGIPLPFDDKFVTYVWFDALLNYLCATGWPDKFDEKLWSESVHLIGKDILKTHAVYWPAMLLSLGVPIFKRLEVNGFVLVSGTKMSKSLGNVIRPLEVEALYGRETLRFYLLKEISYGLDSTFTVEGFIQSVNAHLANGIGNLVSRVLTLCQNGYSGTRKRTLTDRDRAALAERALALKAWDDGFGEWKYQNAMKAWGDLVTKTDLYVNEMKPWALAKDPAQADRLETVLWVCLKMIQAAGAIVYPVLPEASGKIMKALGISSTPNGPSLLLVTDDAQELKISTEVPRLFARIAKPTEDQK
jgi:methionyl-tRNA synthetase